MAKFDDAIIEDAINKAILAAKAEATAIYVVPKNHRSYKCAAPSCNRFAYASGLCNAHLIRAKNGRNFADPIRARKRHDTCSECGCVTGKRGGWGLCVKHYKKTRVRTIKTAAVSLFGGKCSSCGNVFPLRAFDFHHLENKDSSIAELMSSASPKAIATELSKCALLCANCHRITHDG